MKKTLSLLLVLTAYSTLAFAQDAEVKATEKIAPMKVGVIDNLGDENTVVRAWKSGKDAWVPYVKVVVHFPGYEQEDTMVVQFKKGSKKIGKPYVCKPKSWLKHYSPQRSIPTIQVDLTEFECRLPEEYKQKGTGNYQVELSIRQPLAEKTTKLGSYEFKVKNIKHGSRNKPSKVHTSSFDSVLGAAFIYHVGRGGTYPLKAIADGHYRSTITDGGSRPMKIKFWSKVDKESSRLKYNAVCFKDGTRFDASPMTMSQTESEYWSYKGKADKEQVFWKRHTFTLRNLRFRVGASVDHNKARMFLDNSPGKYQCKFLADGEVKASVNFEVKDGKVVKNKCDDDLNLPDNVNSIAFKDGGVSTVKADKKLKSKIFFSTKKWSKGCPAKK